ncbi:MAG: terminase small subunit [Gammaproteobacteria bacterium]|nr:terminase small subunit [Gammaproteobacteria bacterium]
MANLIGKRARFVEEYVVDSNGSAAAIRAGYARTGAGTTAYRLLKDADVVRAIAALRSRQSAKTEITREKVIEGLMREAEFSGPGASHSARVAAWQALGRIVGVFGIDNRQRSPLASLSRDDLRTVQEAIKVMLAEHDKNRAAQADGAAKPH